MYRQSPSRNQRSKGIKLKYVVQICLLLAVCFWLIYQVKHSHDKKKEFAEHDAKEALLQRENNDGEFMKLGRKDIPKNGKHDEQVEEDENTAEEDVEENKPEEEVEENKPEEDVEENKPEEDEPESETEEKNVEEKENDETREAESEVEREEDLVDENETQEVESEDGQSQTEKENTSDESDRDGDNNKSTHEAREENYKADDASSAVTHEIQTGSTENEIEHVENSTELEIASGDTEHGSNMTTTGDIKVDLFDGSENGSPPNNTVIGGSSDGLTTNSSSEVKIENQSDHESQPIITTSERSNNSIVNDGTNSSDSNSTVYSEDFSNSINNNTESSSENNDETEKSDTYENSESTVTENPEEVQHDGIDISDTSDLLEEKHVRTDLDTLPEIQTEGTNSEDDVAVE